MNYLKTLLVLLLTINISCSSSKANSKKEIGKTYHILFVGNSLTYYNNLPELVKIEAKKVKIDIETKMVALPNYAIMDHWNNGKVQEEISKGIYDYVVVQQGPSSQAYGKQLLFDYGKKLNILCKNTGTKLCFFMVWPSRQYYHTFNGVIQNHREIATITNSILCPVGEVWKSHFDKTNSFEFYGPDGFHPSLAGSKVAAEVIVNSLFTKNLRP